MDGSPQQQSGPRVLIVGTEALNLRIPLMDELVRRGFQPCAAGALPQPEFSETAFDYYQYPVCRSVSPRGFYRSIASLREVIRQAQPDLVHALNTKPCLIAPRATRDTGIPCIRTITGLGSAFSSDGLIYRGMRCAFRHLHRRIAGDVHTTVFQNPDDRDYFVNAGLIRAEDSELILGSGIDVDRLRSTVSSPRHLDQLRSELNLQGRTVITMVSRMMRTKGVIELTDAAEELHRQYSDAVVLLVGPLIESGPAALPRSLVSSSSAVQWIGPRADVADILAISDVFVLPTYLREGIPRVLFEAGALKLPIVTTDTPGCRETVRDGWNGYLIPPRDRSAIVHALKRLLDSPEQRREMGRNSLALVNEQFHLSTVADGYARVYAQALGLTHEAHLKHAA